MRILLTTLSEAFCVMALVSNPKVPTGHSQRIWELPKLGTARIARLAGEAGVRCKEIVLLQKSQKREIFCLLFDLSKK